MPVLATLLAQTSRRFLLAVARTHRLSGLSERPKAALVAALTTHLTASDQLQALIAGLTDAERAVLVDLTLANGQLPRRHLTQVHGHLRPFRPWQPNAAQRPWENPISPLERLWFLGIIFLDKETDTLHLPQEVQVQVIRSAAQAPLDHSPAVLVARQFCHDLVQLGGSPPTVM